MRNTPFFSVVVCNYNYGHFIRQCIESVLKQTDSDFELIIVDDGSTDCSREVLRSFRDTRITTVHKDNGGQASAFNLGFSKSRGELICFLDSDDWWTPDKLESIRMAHSLSGGSYGIMQHQLEVWEDGPVGPYLSGMFSGDVFKEMTRSKRLDFFSPTTGIVVRRAVLNEVLPIPLEYKTCADGFITRASIVHGPLFSVPKVCGYYRKHTNWVLGNSSFNVELFCEKLLYPTLNHYYEQNNVNFSYPIVTEASIESILLKELVKSRWELLGQTYPEVAVYGAGKHSQWLERLSRNIPGPKVIALIDDRGPLASPLWQQTAVPLGSLCGCDLPPVVISSDTFFEEMRSRCLESLGEDASLINLYENVPMVGLTKIPKQIDGSWE